VPTYRYRCDRCGDEFEVWQSFSDDPVTHHEGDCGGEVRKVLVPAGIVLKGSGFYKTDSRSSSRGKSDGAKRSDNAGPTSKEQSKPEKTTTSSSDSSSSSSSSSAAKPTPPSTPAAPTPKEG